MNSTLVKNICPRHRGKVGHDNERKREMEKEKSDAALARIFDDPSFPFFSICCTNDSSARAACVEHSSKVFRHEASMNVRVFLHDYLYTYAACKVEFQTFNRSYSQLTFSIIL